jgi:hypothetical protein
MPTELFTIGAEAWMLAAVATLGVVVLPWTALEVAQVTRAATTARRLMRFGVRWSRSRSPALAAISSVR